MIAAGVPAPEFEAPDQDGRPFRLSSLKGAPVVLFFYPKADTPGCTIESKGFQTELPQYQAKGVHVVGISTDDCDAQKAFARKYGLAFPLVADREKKVARLYGVLGLTGSARRVTFLIDSAGVVQEVVEGASPKPHLDQARSRFLSG
jgi:peroxiredoxin Q/BCP